MIGADVENGFVEVHVLGLQPCDLSQASPSICQDKKQSLGNLTAGKGRYHKVELVIIDGEPIGIAASRSLDLDGLEDIAEVQIMFQQDVIDGRFDDTKPCIPGRKSRKKAVKYDKRRYKRRNRIERMFGRLKNWRRFATRNDRSPTVFLSTIALAATVIFWL
jgi:hypothetical protein